MGRISRLFRRKSDELNCKEVQGLASDYVDEEMDESMLAKVKRHLGLCEGCESFMKSFSRTVRLLRSMPKPKAPEAVRQRILEQTETKKSEVP